MESDVVEGARRGLGLKWAVCRRAVGYGQADFASLIGYSRSTIANVETGRQHVPAVPLVLANGDGVYGPLVQVSGDGLRVSGHDDDWLGVIALAASEAREHAEKLRLSTSGPRR